MSALAAMSPQSPSGKGVMLFSSNQIVVVGHFTIESFERFKAIYFQAREGVARDRPSPT